MRVDPQRETVRAIETKMPNPEAKVLEEVICF